MHTAGPAKSALLAFNFCIEPIIDVIKVIIFIIFATIIATCSTIEGKMRWTNMIMTRTKIGAIIFWWHTNNMDQSFCP